MAGAHGVFHQRLDAPRGAMLRARAGRAPSYPFRARQSPNRRVNPFGGPINRTPAARLAQRISLR
jgi:hypothetical protein